jgi:S1-C subfamily serine protease
MAKILAASRPGDLVTLGVRREGGKTDVVIATLARAPGNDSEYDDDARVKELRDQLQKLDAERRRIFEDLEKRLADLRGGKASKESERPVAPPRVDTPPKPEETKPTPEEPRAPLAVSIGAALLDLTPEERKELSVEGGVKVTRVVAQGAADEAGVKSDDVITKVGGETLTGTGHLRVILGKMNPGDKLELEVLRDGKKISIDVTLRPAK